MSAESSSSESSSSVEHGSPHARGEECSTCERPARHKVGEEDARPGMHNYTAYLCCVCFGRVMGPVAYEECVAAHGQQRSAQEAQA